MNLELYPHVGITLASETSLKWIVFYFHYSPISIQPHVNNMIRFNATENVNKLSCSWQKMRQGKKRKNSEIESSYSVMRTYSTKADFNRWTTTFCLRSSVKCYECGRCNQLNTMIWLIFPTKVLHFISFHRLLCHWQNEYFNFTVLNSFFLTRSIVFTVRNI